MKEKCESMTCEQLLRDFNRLQNNEIAQFEEHEACWDLHKRGEAGETILHLCYLNNTQTHFEIARLLLEEFPKMAMDIYEGREYYGEFKALLIRDNPRFVLPYLEITYKM